MDDLRSSIRAKVEDARGRGMTVSVNAVAAELADKFAPEEEAKKLMIARSIIKQCRAAGIPMILGPGLLREDGAISPAEGQPRGRGTIPFGGA